MIQVNDLRIGNWLTFISVPVKMSAINWEEWGELRPYFEYNNNKYYTATFDSLHPIPLDAELLEKCGFEMPAKICYLNKDWFLHQNVDGFFLQVERQGESEYILERLKLDCQYLHQLQNLIYFISGKELEIKLTQTTK